MYSIVVRTHSSGQFDFCNDSKDLYIRIAHGCSYSRVHIVCETSAYRRMRSRNQTGEAPELRSRV